MSTSFMQKKKMLNIVESEKHKYKQNIKFK